MWLSLAGGVWGLFSLAENTVRPEVKSSISQWLRNPSGPLERWPVTFAKVFDSVFGVDHPSWRCFRRSCVASLACVSIVTLIWGALRTDEFMAFIAQENIGSLAAFPFLFAFMNLIPDYLSLLETRYVIRWTGNQPSLVRLLAFLIIDLAATSVIALGAVVGLWGFYRTVAPWYPVFPFLVAIKSYLKHAPFLTVMAPGFLSPGIWFYSTFFTSIWVWLYGLSGLIVRLAGSLGAVFRGLEGILDIDNRPLHAIGLVWSVLVTIGYVLLLILWKGWHGS